MNFNFRGKNNTNDFTNECSEWVNIVVAVFFLILFFDALTVCTNNSKSKKSTRKNHCPAFFSWCDISPVLLTCWFIDEPRSTEIFMYCQWTLRDASPTKWSLEHYNPALEEAFLFPVKKNGRVLIALASWVQEKKPFQRNLFVPFPSLKI